MMDAEAQAHAERCNVRVRSSNLYKIERAGPKTP
jgi:hypothetical protein